MRKNYSKKYMLLCAFLMMSVMAFAQKGSIKGKVIDETNQPMPGVSVVIDGTTIGATTDANGVYTITGVTPGNYTLTAKFIGYVASKQTITVGSSVLTVNFGLKPENQNLNEVVVIGYGSSKKKDLTGSVVSVSEKDFNQGPVTTPEALITGKVSGVEITSNSGAPGAGSTIRIRGGASLNASNDPLIVIDNVPVANTGIAGVANALATLNPDDIESFTVLKDASATAIYGSRASNGVIIITTKKGKGGDKVNINFSSENSLSKIVKEYPVLSAAEFRTVVAGQDALHGTTYATLLGSSNTDWQKQIYQQAFTTDDNISFSGGIKGLPYRLSIGYLDQDGILKTDNLKRTTVALNVNHDFLDKSLKIDLNVKTAYTQSIFANQGAIGAAASFDPTQSVYSGNKLYGGYFEWISSGAPNGPYNPVGLLNESTGRGYATRETGSLNVNYTFPFLKELQFNATFGGDLSDGMGNNFTPATAASAFAGGGSFSQYFSENYTYNNDYYLKYSKDFKSINSHLDVQAGYSYQYFHLYTKAEASYNAARTTVNTPAPVLFPGQYYIESPFGRVNFDIDEKYLITATIRDDRSSRFGPDNRNGYFPSVGVAWRLKQEDFLKSVDVLSDLKLRVGYGITGQQDIGANYFPYLAVYEPSNSGAGYIFGNGTGTYTNTLRADAYNANLKWESTATTNIAMDYGFLNGRINGSIEYYYKKTKDLLVFTPVPDGTNLSNYITANIGNLVTKGIDFNINVIAIASRDINWTMGYNVSYNNRTVTNISLTKDPNLIIPTGSINGLGNTIQIYKAGVAPNAFYPFQQVYGSNGAPLEGVYVDRNNNGTTTDDQYVYKQPAPVVFMGFSNDFSYKKWDLAFTLRADLGNYVYNDVAASAALLNIKPNNTTSLGNLPSSILKTNFQSPQNYSDYFIENGSFLRMDNVNLGYNFGKIAKVGTLRASFTVQNVFVVTKYTGLDPEVQGGIDNNLYPRPRVFSLGVNLNL
jgi:TonB-dependent starch-binding outer membrane protein SusC